jgi:DNA-binding NarL/FixJ family response regulator
LFETGELVRNRRNGYPIRKAALSMPITSERTAVLVDEHPLWLDTIEQVVEPVRMRVLAKVTRASAALGVLSEQTPDLLVTGIRMPDGEINGIDLVRRALERLPNMKAIVLSMYEERTLVEASFAAGAFAYVLKSADPDDLRAAIRQAFEPSVFFAPELADNEAEPAESPPVDPGLTRREIEILRLVAEGYSNAQLAKMLWVTEQTVKFHLSNIYRKLDVANRTEASRWAQVHGLLASRQLI